MPSASPVYRILKEAKFHPYKMQIHQELAPHHRIRQVAHAHLLLDMKAHSPGYHNQILFSDEAHFSLHGEVNHHNF